MLQVMTQNHVGACAAKTMPNVGGPGAYEGKGGQVPHVKSVFFANTGILPLIAMLIACHHHEALLVNESSEAVAADLILDFPPIAAPG